MSSVSLAALLLLASPAHAGPFDELFGYSEVPQKRDLNVFPQWLAILHAAQSRLTISKCDEATENANCATQRWQTFLQGLAGLPARKQLEAVNKFANAQRYVLDTKNYGRADYWALPAQFLANGGDCEDYALLKFLSLRQLGWPAESMRLVIVQDTQLRQAHAVLAVAGDDGILILDNQQADIVDDRSIAHYAPVYSIGDSNWSLHKPHS